MTPEQPLRSLARVLILLVLALAVPNAALGRAAPDQTELAREARARLAQAAEDSGLAPWQRDLMLSLARTGTTGALDPPAADLRAAAPALASGAADSAWSRLAPSARYCHSAIYDAVRNCMVVFGGYEESFDSGGGWELSLAAPDVWELSLGDVPAWTPLTPVGTPPSARQGQSAIFDPVRDRMLVFGGSSASGLFNDVWALSLGDGPTWTQLTPSGVPPSARTLHSAIYDPVRDHMVVFGGYAESGRLNDVWELSLAGTPAWMPLTPSGAPPSARYLHSAIYDPVRDRIVAFGGSSGSGFVNDIWALSLAGTPAWTPLTPSGTAPSARYGHCTIYDPVRDRMVVFGGYSDNYINDVWALSLAGTPAWTPQTPPGTPQSGRALHSAIYDPVRDRIVAFGGHSGYSFLSDVQALSLAGAPAWAQLATPPMGRYAHSAIYDPVRDRMVVFGGHSDNFDLNDTWTLSLAGTQAWAQLTPSGTPPSGRGGHSAIYDPVRDRMLVFGGSPDSGILNDVWALSLGDVPAWTPLTPSGTPPSARYAQSAIYDPVRDRMVVFGGYSGSTFLNDAWVLSLAGTPAWTQLTPSGPTPDARIRPSVIYDPVRDRLVVFGGSPGFGFVNDIWALSLAGTPAWTQLTPPGIAPEARWGPSAIYDPVCDGMVVFGGASYSGLLSDVWTLSLAGPPAWTQLTPSGTTPNARFDTSVIYDPVRDHMVVFGGHWWAYYVNDVWTLGFVRPDATGVEPQPLISGLRPPAPNPTRATAAVSYTLAHAGHVQLGVYDVCGRLVHQLVDGERPAGVETVVWNGMDESGARPGAGVYFVRLAGSGLRETRRVILLR